MNKDDMFHLYKGDGRTIRDTRCELPDYERLAGLDDPRHYLASSALKDAVNVALALGQPLLVTGEPGTGKTQLAGSIARELGLHLFMFQTKTTSLADDLFYQYDALRRFQDAQAVDLKPMESYITCRALGLAILLANPTPRAAKLLPEHLKAGKPVRSVVLIDEIDKAPRDLPNDLLAEIEKMRFRIKETIWDPFQADPKYRPIVILTSNSEKNLPDAFLRRCVFHHIEFPEPQALKQIIFRRFSDRDGHLSVLSEAFVDNALAHFYGIRKNLGMKKDPSTAELLAWLSVLRTLNLDMANLTAPDREKVEMSYAVLAKSREDMDRLKRYLDQALRKP